MKNNKGISLIVLIVTIIVIVIIASIIIISIRKNNPVESAKEARFKEDVNGFKLELSHSIGDQFFDNNGKRKNKINTSNFEEIKEYIHDFSDNYKDKFVIINDELIGTKELTDKEIEWLDDIQIKAINFEMTNSIGSIGPSGVPIPKGFTYVDGQKNTGIVIEDSKGNQFVWVPATTDTYIKNERVYGMSPTGDDSLPSGISDESLDVSKYKGFYIGRYECGIPQGDLSPSNKQGVPVIKKGATVWTNINYTNAKSNSENMISNDYVKTGLISSTAWDTTCNWFLSTGVLESFSVSNTVGNYGDSASPANVDGYGNKQKTGYSDKWALNNIYDMAGNVSEFVSEKKDNARIYRGGSYFSTSSAVALVARSTKSTDDTDDTIGFRVRLYIK